VKSGNATISANNTVTLTGIGTVILAANQTGNANYNAATEVTTSFAVAKGASKILTMPTASSLRFGDTLVAAKLSGGSANVPGKFVFLSPTTKPPAGNSTQTIQFVPTDAGYSSASATLTVVVNKAILTIPAPRAEDGSITAGFAGSTVRDLGANYTVSATAASGMQFKQWRKNGVVLTSNVTLNFKMEPGLTLSPEFVPNFSALAGVFNGLIGTGEIGTGSAADMQSFPANNGFLSVTTTANGTFNGILRMQGRSDAFSGTIGSNKTARVVVNRKTFGNATLTMNLKSALPGEMNGTLGVGGKTLSFRALRGAYTGNASAHAIGGRQYTVVIPPPIGVSMGYGYATLTVASKGTASLLGKLATGATLNATASIVDDGSGNWVFPTYMDGSETFLGEIVIPKITPSTGSEIDGSLEWLKPSTGLGLFKSGFLKRVAPMGTRHISTNPALGVSGNFTLSLDPLKTVLSSGLIQKGTWPASNAPSLTAPIKQNLKLSYTAASGVFSGNFSRTVNGAPITTPYQGVIFSRPLAPSGGAGLRGMGYFTTENASVTVQITVP
jgi:hypothetical protein